MQIVIGIIAVAISIFGAASVVSYHNTTLPTPTPIPVPTVIPTTTPIKMTFEEADVFFKEKYGVGLFPTDTPKPITAPIQKINLNEKNTCWVEKNGSFEMTLKECKELYDRDPFNFSVKAYQNCLAGKNPSVGDVGSPEDRKERCSNLTGIEEK